MKKRFLILTGSPGVGKTTMLLKVVEVLRTRGHSVGGILSREVRSCGRRIGFEILDLASSRHGWLAHVSQKDGPRIGNYRVNLEDLDGLGTEAIGTAVDKYDVVVIDEVGPMELLSVKLRESIKRAAESEKLVIGVVHWRARDELISEIKGRKDAQVYVVTPDNRCNLHEIIIIQALKFFQDQASNNLPGDSAK